VHLRFRSLASPLVSASPLRRRPSLVENKGPTNGRRLTRTSKLRRDIKWNQRNGTYEGASSSTTTQRGIKHALGAARLHREPPGAQPAAVADCIMFVGVESTALQPCPPVVPRQSTAISSPAAPDFTTKSWPFRIRDTAGCSVPSSVAVSRLSRLVDEPSRHRQNLRDALDSWALV
jgi:hypothetical protein